jgi:hypothetical protein
LTKVGSNQHCHGYFRKIEVFASVTKALFTVTLAALAAIGTAADSEIIVESANDGFNAEGFKQTVGKWAESSAKSTAPGLHATKAYYNDANSTGPASARFMPNVPVAGHYEVFATYPPSGNAAGVVYKVVSADGEKSVNLDQNGRDPSARPPANQWFSLGTYNFQQGSNGYVEISDPLTGKRAFDKEPNARIYADAIKLVPKDVKLPADFANKVKGQVPTGGITVAAASGPATGAAVGTESAPAGTGLPPMPPASGASTSAGAPLPSLPGGSGTSAASLPALPSAGGASTSLPALPGAPASAPAASGSLPSLPSAGASSPAGLPALPSSGATAGASLPALPSAGSSAAAPASSGLPSLPGAPASTGSAAALPALPGAGTATAPASSGLPSLPGASASAGSASSAPPSLPSVPGTAPASGTMPGLPGMPGAASSAPGALPPLATPGPASATALPGTPTLPAIPAVPGSSATASAPAAAALPPGLNLPPVPGTAPSAPAASAPAPAAVAGSTESNPSNLQWSFDFGAALNQARAANKKVLVFFVAPGNKQAIKYETEYFQNPAVRAELDKYILVKINFPQNTRLGYALDIYGAGQIAITDVSGTKIGSVEQIPASPEDLIKALQAIK